jgi:hypothetical protein
MNSHDGDRGLAILLQCEHEEEFFVGSYGVRFRSRLLESRGPIFCHVYSESNAYRQACSFRVGDDVVER